MTILVQTGADIRYALAESAGTGEILTIIYEGGTQPGSKREIVVRFVRSDRISAVEFATGQTKTFLLDKLHVVPEDYPAPRYIPADSIRKQDAPPSAQPAKTGILMTVLTWIGLLYLGYGILRWLLSA